MQSAKNRARRRRPSPNQEPAWNSTDDLLNSLSDSELQSVEHLATKCLLEGATLADIRGFTANEMEAVYHLAYNAYQQRKYENSLKLFQFLVQHDHSDCRFWMGLAACHQLSGNYKQAVNAYGMSAVLDATNPRPALHACECHLALKDWANARKALDAVNLICGLDTSRQYAGTQMQAKRLAAIISNSVSADGNRATNGEQPESDS